MTIWEHFKYIFRLIFLPGSLRTMEWKMLKLVNKDRRMHGLKPLKMQDDLREVARKHSRDMARKGYFEHENIVGQTPFDRLEAARVTDIHAGENLAKIRGHKNPVKRAEIGLMNSPGHRANILNNNYNTIGIGVIKSIDRSFIFTQNFARRELIFTHKIPHKTTIKKGLHIKGFSFSDVQRIIYQVKKHLESKETIYENLIEIKDNKFDFKVPFKDIGIFNVLIFINKKNEGENFRIANKFEIKVKKGWIF